VQAVVNAPVDSVFDYLSDFAHNPDWCDMRNYALVRVEQTSTGEVRQGSTFKMRVHETHFGSSGAKSEYDRDYEVKVTDFVLNKTLTFRSYRPFAFEMEPAPGGTRLWLRQNIADAPRSEAERRRERGAFGRFMAALGDLSGPQLWLLFPPAWPVLWIHNRLVSTQILLRVKEAVEDRLERT
jgi:hypothetical protein